MALDTATTGGLATLGAGDGLSKQLLVPLTNVLVQVVTTDCRDAGSVKLRNAEPSKTPSRVEGVFEH